MRRGEGAREVLTETRLESPHFCPCESLIRRLKRHHTVEWKWLRGPTRRRQQQRVQPGHVRKVTSQHDVANLELEAVGHPLRVVLRLQIARRTELREGIARTPEALGGLFRAELAAVPDHHGLDTERCGFGCETFDLLATCFRERTQRIDTRTKRLAVMNKIKSQREDASRRAAQAAAEVRCGRPWI